jgi:type IV pilus assembly protein PilP
MKKIPDLLRTMFLLTAAVFLWVGCDDPPKTAEQPPAVRKKIAAHAETGPVAVKPPAAVGDSVAPATAQAAAPGKPAPAAPPPKPAEPAPPTRAPLTLAASSPGQPAAAGSAGAKAVAESSQVATLLNIQVPAPYDPKGKVNPFEPLLKDESAAVAIRVRTPTDPNRPKTPLEKLDLGQLKLVAIIATPTGNRAMVEESTGKGYIIKTGTFIGLNSGKVVDIKEGKVLVEEEFEDVYGKAIVQKKEITLPKPPGEL